MPPERSNTLTKCIQFSVDRVRLSEQQKAKQCSESLGKETGKLGVGKYGAQVFLLKSGQRKMVYQKIYKLRVKM